MLLRWLHFRGSRRLLNILGIETVRKFRWIDFNGRINPAVVEDCLYIREHLRLEQDCEVTYTLQMST